MLPDISLQYGDHIPKSIKTTVKRMPSILSGLKPKREGPIDYRLWRSPGDPIAEPGTIVATEVNGAT